MKSAIFIYFCVCYLPIYIHTVVFASRIIRQMCLVFFGSRTVYVEPTERSWNGDSNHDTHYAYSPKIDIHGF